jgi:hypothetical protein
MYLGVRIYTFTCTSTCTFPYLYMFMYCKCTCIHSHACACTRTWREKTLLKGQFHEIFYSSLRLPVMNTRGSQPELFLQRICRCKIHWELKTPLWLIHWGDFTPWSTVFVTRKFLLETCSDACSKYTSSSQRSWESSVYSPPVSWDSLCIYHRESQDWPVYLSPRRRFGHRGVILHILRSTQQSLKELSF